MKKLYSLLSFMLIAELSFSQAYIRYDFTTAAGREEAVVTVNEQKASINQSNTDALYIDYADFWNNVLFSIELSQPLDMSLSRSLKWDVNFGHTMDIDVYLYDGGGQSVLLKSFSGEDADNAYWADILNTESEKTAFDFSDIRRIEFSRPWGWDVSGIAGTMKIRNISFGNYGQPATQTSTCFVYNYDGNRLHNNIFVNNFNTGMSSWNRSTDGKLEITMKSSGQWNPQYYGITLNNTIDMSGRQIAEIELNTTRLALTDDIEFVLVDVNDASVSKSVATPNGKIVLDYTNEIANNGSFDATKVKNLKLQGTTWGNSGLGTFDISYLLLGDKGSTVNISENEKPETINGYCNSDRLYIINTDMYFSAKIYNANGKLCRIIENETNSYIGDLPLGVYLVSVESGAKTTCFKVVK